LFFIVRKRRDKFDQFIFGCRARNYAIPTRWITRRLKQFANVWGDENIQPERDKQRKEIDEKRFSWFWKADI
jgi:hypothetical protein